MVKPYVCDVSAYLYNAIKEGKNILLEGQKCRILRTQGSHPGTPARPVLPLAAPPTDSCLTTLNGRHSLGNSA